MEPEEERIRYSQRLVSIFNSLLLEVIILYGFSVYQRRSEGTILLSYLVFFFFFCRVVRTLIHPVLKWSYSLNFYRNHCKYCKSKVFVDCNLTNNLEYWYRKFNWIHYLKNVNLRNKPKKVSFIKKYISVTY